MANEEPNTYMKLINFCMANDISPADLSQICVAFLLNYAQDDDAGLVLFHAGTGEISMNAFRDMSNIEEDKLPKVYDRLRAFVDTDTFKQAHTKYIVADAQGVTQSVEDTPPTETPPKEKMH